MGDTAPYRLDTSPLQRRFQEVFDAVNGKGQWQAQVCVTATATAILMGCALGDASAAQRYKLKHGETVEAIGRRFHIPARDILAANHLDANDILADGRSLIIPDAPKPTIVPPTMHKRAQLKADRVRVRIGPGSARRRLKVYEKGTGVVVTAKRGGWSQVTFADGISGWVRSDLVRYGGKGGDPLTGNTPKPRKTPGPVQLPIATTDKWERTRMQRAQSGRGKKIARKHHEEHHPLEETSSKVRARKKQIARQRRHEEAVAKILHHRHLEEAAAAKRHQQHLEEIARHHHEQKVASRHAAAKKHRETAEALHRKHMQETAEVRHRHHNEEVAHLHRLHLKQQAGHLHRLHLKQEAEHIHRLHLKQQAEHIHRLHLKQQAEHLHRLHQMEQTAHNRRSHHEAEKTAAHYRHHLEAARAAQRQHLAREAAHRQHLAEAAARYKKHLEAAAANHRRRLQQAAAHRHNLQVAWMRHHYRGNYHHRYQPEAESPSASTDVVRAAYAYRGTPYRWGEARPGGFDCSGFTKYVYARKGVALPRTAAEQFHAGHAVNHHDLKPGDLVFFHTTHRGISHVGMYVGNGKFVHSSSRKLGGVRVDNLESGYYNRAFRGARRVRKEISEGSGE